MREVIIQGVMKLQRGIVLVVRVGIFEEVSQYLEDRSLSGKERGASS